MPENSNHRTTSDHSRLAAMRQDARTIFNAGLEAVGPEDAVHRHCRRDGGLLKVGQRTYDLSRYDRIFVVGAGKATAAMARAAEDLLPDEITDGLISVKYDHTVALKRIRTIEAGHPLPDANGAAASRQILEMVAAADEKDLVLVLLSGGGSALLPLPVDGISLEEKQTASDVLIGCGATIHEINTIRKHLSQIKGGRLAHVAAPTTVISLMLSDVVGDDMDVIASGPTVPDASTFRMCQEIIQRHGIHRRMPASVASHLSDGCRRPDLETPKPQTAPWPNVQNLVVGSNLEAIVAAGRHAETLGYHTLRLSSLMEGETRTVAQVHTAMAREILASGNPLAAPACLLSGGETTVTLKGDGKGGRNQEFALAAAMEIDGAAHIVVLSGGTDGTDGPTDAAGAVADDTTAERARQTGQDLRRHLENNDAYPLFHHLDDLLMTGPTQTNVMDLRIVLVDAPTSTKPSP